MRPYDFVRFCVAKELNDDAKRRIKYYAPDILFYRDKGLSLLEHAIKVENRVMFDWLLSKYPFVATDVSPEGRTPLHTACSFVYYGGDLYYAKRLLVSGLDINASDDADETALDVAYRLSGRLDERCEFLLLTGCVSKNRNGHLFRIIKFYKFLYVFDGKIPYGLYRKIAKFFLAASMHVQQSFRD